MAASSKRRASDSPRLGSFLWFLAGLACRVLAFRIPHDEGDEIVYRALVHQLEDGAGYTLRGTALIDHGWPADQYGHALFFHPPGGIAFFALLDRVFGEAGYPLAQLLGYAVFFWSTMALARQVASRSESAPGARTTTLRVVAALAAFTPLMTHVTARYWLDMPMLALVTLTAALFVRALPPAAGPAGGAGWAVAAATAMGAASWVKTAALVGVPGILVLAWAITDASSRRALARLAVIFVALSLAIQLPWEIWQWIVLGSPFPAWAGRPSPQLIAFSPYVRRLTVDRPAWIYLTLLPRATWTLAPALLGLAAARLDAPARRAGLALAAWIAIVVAVVVGLGAIGYSKLLRYAILVVPATVLLFSLVAGELWRAATAPHASGAARVRAVALAVLAGAGFALEIAQGIYTPLIDKRDLIWPLLWRGNGLY